jgi:hypothetical protein
LIRLSVRDLAEFLFVVCIAACITCLTEAQTCSQAPTPPHLNPDEAVADNASEAALNASGGCTKVAGCTQATNTFNALRSQALSPSGGTAECAATGSNAAGAPLSASDKAWYVKRSTFWSGIYQSLQAQASAVANGTYKLSDQDRADIFWLPPRKTIPTATTAQCSCNTPYRVSMSSEAC